MDSASKSIAIRRKRDALNIKYSEILIFAFIIFLKTSRCHPTVSARWLLRCFVSLHLLPGALFVKITSSLKVIPPHSTFSTYRCQESHGSWLLKQNRYPWALSACALISSKHHLPKYLCCIHGRCLEGDTEEQGETQPVAWSQIETLCSSYHKNSWFML